MSEPVDILRDLIAIESCGPPSQAATATDYVKQRLHKAGVDATVIEYAPGGCGLVARIAGHGRAPAVLLHARTDVVPAASPAWNSPPFRPTIVDGVLTGRGAVAPKSGLAMLLSALIRMHEQDQKPAGDLVLAIGNDMETLSPSFAEHLVAEHEYLFHDVRYAVGDEGGATLRLGTRRLHPVVVAEKRFCWTRLTINGPGGHAARLPVPDNTAAQLGRLLTTLSAVRLPRHLTPPTERMLDELERVLPPKLADAVGHLHHDSWNDAIPYDLPLAEALELDTALRHTINPTVIRAPGPVNVLPTEITLELDGRILPGVFSTDDFLDEVRHLIGSRAAIRVLAESPPPSGRTPIEPMFGRFYQSLVKILKTFDPVGTALPMIAPASTAAQHFSRLGIRCYGWVPLLLPVDTEYRRLLHACDERLPVSALEFGVNCLSELLLSYR